MKHITQILTFILLLFYNSAQSQVTEEYNRFLVDSSLTEWIEYTYLPKSSDRAILTDHTIKDYNSNSVIEKTFEDGKVDLWTILKYDENWKILEEISLMPDSSVESIEKFTYDESRVISTYFNEKNEVDTSFQYFYNEDGSFQKTLFYGIDIDGNQELTKFLYTYNSNYLLKKFEIIKTLDNDTISYEYLTHHYNKDGLKDSILVFDKKNRISEKTYFTYDVSGRITKNSFSYDNKFIYSENYIIEETNKVKRILIVGYSNNDGFIKRIEIKKLTTTPPKLH